MSPTGKQGANPDPCPCRACEAVCARECVWALSLLWLTSAAYKSPAAPAAAAARSRPAVFPMTFAIKAYGKSIF